MNILVTGGIGFIGSHLCEALLVRGHSVVAFDNLDPFYPPARKQANLDLLRNKRHFSYIHGDVRRRSDLHKAFKERNIEHVFHLAGRGGMTPSVAKPLLYLDETVRATLLVLECCREFGVASFVHAGSSSVYGRSDAKRFSESLSTDMPTAPYAAFKKADELIGHAYHHLHGMTVVNARLFSVYGPRGRPDQIIYKMTAAIDAETPLLWYEPEPIRDFTYVSDIVDGLIRCLDLPPHTYEVLNLAYGQPYALSTVVKLVEKALGKKAVFKKSGPPPRSDFPRTCADITKVRRVLSWRPQVPLSNGIGLFVDWYRNIEAQS
ncbi:MAG: NAD-dependent epimerase/dehydratase family protein [Patescibacteria group bacterium]